LSCFCHILFYFFHSRSDLLSEILVHPIETCSSKAGLFQYPPSYPSPFICVSFDKLHTIRSTSPVLQIRADMKKTNTLGPKAIIIQSLPAIAVVAAFAVIPRVNIPQRLATPLLPGRMQLPSTVLWLRPDKPHDNGVLLSCIHVYQDIDRQGEL
jgi:hypothetical protein